MEITLGTLLGLERNEDKSMLQVKRELLAYKKSGIVFYSEEIASLDLHTPFQMYFAYRPGHKTETNAFPVPMEDYGLLCNEKDKFTRLKTYFSNYYHHTEFSLDTYRSYEEGMCYKGTDFVWYAKKK